MAMPRMVRALTYPGYVVLEATKPRVEADAPVRA